MTCTAPATPGIRHCAAHARWESWAPHPDTGETGLASWITDEAIAAAPTRWLEARGMTRDADGTIRYIGTRNVVR